MKSLTQHNHHIASLFICDHHVGHEFDNGSILVQGKYFNICQQSNNEELSHGSIIEKAFVCCSQVSDEHQNHMGGVHIGIFSFLYSVGTR